MLECHLAILNISSKTTCKAVRNFLLRPNSRKIQPWKDERSVMNAPTQSIRMLIKRVTGAIKSNGCADSRTMEHCSLSLPLPMTVSFLLDSSIAASAYAGHLHSKSAIPLTLPAAP
ncbi:hypothetical protein K470DRAFT_121816 [Piedraia hortae CBS 480.64]|uniref:Uncharacterized protein n=1 Tax=Piedraia hortae CBS 480.64 TaxID=1314780 RepID=A0A6A7C889_9PEZI|nr:hypothetical protein K470DRAFT_121816 [Piedraia hortae CBS 480.64]